MKTVFIFDVKRLQDRNIGYQVRKPERYEKCNESRWWCDGVGTLVWRSGAYNDGNGCRGAGATFIIHALELPAANGMRGGGICNVIVRGGGCAT